MTNEQRLVFLAMDVCIFCVCVYIYMIGSIYNCSNSLSSQLNFLQILYFKFYNWIRHLGDTGSQLIVGFCLNGKDWHIALNIYYNVVSRSDFKVGHIF